MLNHDTGHMDWQDPGSASPNNGYINPNNLYDQMTHVGREALSDASSQSFAQNDDAGTNKHAKAFFLVVLAIMILVFFFIPGHS